MRSPGSVAIVTLLSIAMAAALAPASHAETLLSEAQALKLVFPKAQSVVTEVRTLSPEQRTELEKSTRLHFPEKDFRCFIGHGKQGIDGYAVILNEVGKHEFITFIAGVTPKGEVSDVAVMEYREARGWEVKEQRFLRQFHGKKLTDPITVDSDIVNYTGATLSSHAIARGVKKALAIVNQFYLSQGAPAK